MFAIASATRWCSSGSFAIVYSRIFQSAFIGISLDDRRLVVLYAFALQEPGKMRLYRRGREWYSCRDIATQRVFAGMFVRYRHRIPVISADEQPPGVVTTLVVRDLLQDHARTAIRRNYDFGVALDAREAGGHSRPPEGEREVARFLAYDLPG